MMVDALRLSTLRTKETNATFVISVSLSGCRYSLKLEETITLDIAIQALAPVAPRERTYPCPDAVIKAVAEYFNLSPQDLRGKSRVREIADARHIAMYLLREDAQLPLKLIGRLLGNRDHSTVIHGCRKISTYVKTAKGHRQLADIQAQVRSRA